MKRSLFLYSPNFATCEFRFSIIHYKVELLAKTTFSNLYALLKAYPASTKRSEKKTLDKREKLFYSIIPYCHYGSIFQKKL
jgi:hypothetical protein